MNLKIRNTTGRNEHWISEAPTTHMDPNNRVLRWNLKHDQYIYEIQQAIGVYTTYLSACMQFFSLLFNARLNCIQVQAYQVHLVSYGTSFQTFGPVAMFTSHGFVQFVWQLVIQCLSSKTYLSLT
jgi:hypothetical protein